MDSIVAEWFDRRIAERQETDSMWLIQWMRPLIVVGLIVAAFTTTAPCQAEIRPDFLMDSDPVLNLPDPVKHFSPELKSLWMQALERPESDMQRLAAETIARGHLYGVPDLVEAVPRLEMLLTSEKSHPATRFAAARALIVIESRDSSPKLFQTAQKYEADLRQLVEPALAKWEFAPAIKVWKERLHDSEVRPRDLILALRGLAHVRESSATSMILPILHDDLRSPDVRLEAATAAGQCAVSGLEPDARRCADRPTRRPSVDSLCACRLLARHDSAEAQTILTELSRHPESTVAAAALHRLLEIDSTLVLPLAQAAMDHADPHIRRTGALSCFQHPTSERIASVSRLLADPHPGLRREVCENLFRLADQGSLIDAIRTCTVNVLLEEAWQGQEQAALLAGMLEHQPASSRLVELLESPRGEVGIAAAWALRKVAVAETRPAIIDKVQRQTERRKQVSDPSLDKQVAHLCEALGVLKADEAVPLLVRYLPKDPFMGESSRCASIWALGRIKQGQRDAELEDAFVDRIRDFSDVDPELDLVKEKCAVALARMKAADQAPGMRRLVESRDLGLRLGVAMRWSVMELTGDELPPVTPSRLPPGNWFLEPLSR